MALNNKMLLNRVYLLKYSEIIAAEPFNVIAFFVTCAVLVIFFCSDLLIAMEIYWKKLYN